MNPLRDRVLGALALQPMTVVQLSRCLDLSRQQVHQALRRSDVARVGTIKSNSRPLVIYADPEEFLQPQNENPRYARESEET